MSKIVSKIKQEKKNKPEYFNAGSLVDIDEDLTRKAIIAAIAFVSLESGKSDGSTSELYHNWDEIGSKEFFEKLKSFLLVDLFYGDGIAKDLSDMHDNGEIDIFFYKGKECISVSEDLKNEILSYAEEV